MASATDFDSFTPAGADDLYTAWAANRQPAPAGCRGLEYRKLAGVDDLYTARAANRQPAQAGCGGMAHRKLAGAILHGLPIGSRLGPAAGGWRTGSSLARTTSCIGYGPRLLAWLIDGQCWTLDCSCLGYGLQQLAWLIDGQS